MTLVVVQCSLNNYDKSETFWLDTSNHFAQYGGMLAPLLTRRITYTYWRRRNATTSGVLREGTLLEAFPPHVIAPKKDLVPCVAGYKLEPNKRLNDNVRLKSIVILDVDSETGSSEEYALLNENVLAACRRLEDAGQEYLLYSSYSHGRPKENPPHLYVGYRLVLPFVEPLVGANLAVDYRNVAQAVVDKYALPGNIMPLSQPWYLPSRPTTDAPAVYRYAPGNAVDWRALEIPPAPPRPVVEVAPPPDDAVPVNAAVLRERMLDWGTRSSSADAVKMVLEPRVPALGEVKSRHDNILRPVTLLIAKLAVPGNTVEDLLQVMKPWCDLMDAAYPRGGAGWLEEAGRCLEGALYKVPRWRAEECARLDLEIDQLNRRARNAGPRK